MFLIPFSSIQVFENVHVVYKSRQGIFGERPVMHDNETEAALETKNTGATVKKELIP